jgi:hypothetical protein
VPHGRADWHRFPPAPLSTGRWVFPSPAGSERISAFPEATATPTQRPFARARLCCPHRHRSYGLSRQSAALSATSRFAVIRRVLAIRSGLGWAPDLPHFETSILSLVPPPLRRRALRVLVSDSFPADTGLRPVLTGSALPIPTVGHEYPPKGALGGRPSRRCSDSLNAAAPRIARAPGPTDLDHTAGPPGTCTSGLSRPGVAPRARRI